MKKHTHLFYVLLASVYLCAPATTFAATMDFMQAFEQAQKDDPRILGAEFEYQAMREIQPQARAALLPHVELDIFAGTHNLETTAMPDDDRYDTDGYALTLTQSLYNHSNWLQWQQADLTVAIGEAKVNAARQDLIVRVAQAYYSWLAAQDNLKLATAEKESIGKQLEQNQQRFHVGLIAITDVKESQAQYDLSVAQWIAAENSRATARENLRNLIGVLPENLAPLNEEIPLLMPQPENMDEWIKTAQQNNLALKAAQLSFEVTQKQVGMQRAGHYPSLSLIASRENASTDGLASGDTESTDDSVTLNLNVPIYSGGLTGARTREAVALKEQARVLRDQTQRETEQLCRTSYLGVTTSIARVTAYRQALASTQAAYEATRAGYEVGTRTTIDVLAALREQYRAERDYAQARYDYIINLFRLKQAAGMLSREDVMQVNQWLVH
ncbi:MAG: Type secretion protein TolC [Pseudomonadota bacterium]|nr:Type secretion protein TolC [Pseudomonadota bacterium]